MGDTRDSTRGSYFDEYMKKAGSRVNFFDSQTFNIWDYLRVEMLGIGEPGTLEPPSESHIRNFFMVPLYLEGLIVLGFFICLDAFLYVITYLPIRVMFSIYLLLSNISTQFLGGKGVANGKALFVFHRTHTYDLLRGGMFLLGCLALRQINMSHIYHYIRGQNMIKLYVLTSMLEMLDKLLCSFGQDAFDSLHWQTRLHPHSLQLLATFLMVTGYVIVHSSVYFFHVATLTVVVNSVDKELLTVLILNNFSEMKTFVLKKFDCNNLFQLACADITERFQTFLFLFLILVVAIAQSGPSMWIETVSSFVRIALLLYLAECFADWMKHAFINKFNGINATVYEDFAYVLRNDILSNQKDEVILDHTYSVTRRLGMAQIPLGCVFVRYIMLAISTPSVQYYLEELTLSSIAARCVVVFAVLLVLKIVIGVGLVFYSAAAHRRDASVFLRTPAVKAAASAQSRTGNFLPADPVQVPISSTSSSSSGGGSSSIRSAHKDNNTATIATTSEKLGPASIPTVGATPSGDSSVAATGTGLLSSAIEVRSRNNSGATPLMPSVATATTTAAVSCVKTNLSGSMSAAGDSSANAGTHTAGGGGTTTAGAAGTPRAAGLGLGLGLGERRARGNSVTNPFTELSVSMEELVAAVAHDVVSMESSPALSPTAGSPQRPQHQQQQQPQQPPQQQQQAVVTSNANITSSSSSGAGTGIAPSGRPPLSAIKHPKSDELLVAASSDDPPVCLPQPPQSPPHDTATSDFTLPFPSSTSTLDAAVAATNCSSGGSSVGVVDDVAAGAGVGHEGLVAEKASPGSSAASSRQHQQHHHSTPTVHLLEEHIAAAVTAAAAAGGGGDGDRRLEATGGGGGAVGTGELSSGKYNCTTSTHSSRTDLKEPAADSATDRGRSNTTTSATSDSAGKTSLVRISSFGGGLNERENEVAAVEVAIQEANRMKERLEFMEELSSIERYTVYKGRIL